MSSDEYKAACQCPNAFMRGALEETVRVLQAEAPELVPLIEQALSQAAIEKPKRHAGDETTDYFRVHISAADAEAIRDAFGDKEAEAVSPEGNTTALASHYAGIADAWACCHLWLEDAAV